MYSNIFFLFIILAKIGYSHQKKKKKKKVAVAFRPSQRDAPKLSKIHKKCPRKDEDH